MSVTVVGGGLAGCEAAWHLAELGLDVTLFEMRPVATTPAHQTDGLAELVCSNTFKSLETANAHGLLKAELIVLGSVVLEAAHEASVPGGSALTVDRAVFSRLVTERVTAHPRITLVRQEVTELPSPAVIATGPLTSNRLTERIVQRLGADALAFYDAISPIVSDDSLDHGPLYRLSRYGKGDGDDFLNAPLTRERYEAFVDALIAADQYPGQPFDPIPYFEGCLPIEEMAKRGRETPRFGPMKPVGLPDPATGREPYAVIQLRREDRAGQMWNLVGFQTRMRTGEQHRVFRSVPGLADAEFLRYGSVHRNTYVNSPVSLSRHLGLKDDPRVVFAGQLVGVEGYTESLATGLLAGINLARVLEGMDAVLPPPETMLGALMRYVTGADPKRFQPMNANFGLLPPLETPVKDKRVKREALAARALDMMQRFAAAFGPTPALPLSRSPAT
jgi:methylenetetrahydrofolate--tRNA-(uracil-5-)-methyltransferase